MSEKISKKDIMDFIINEFAKTEKDFDEKTLNFLKQNLKKNEFSEEDFERLKNERENIFKSNQTSKSFDVSSSSSLRSLEFNRDLTTLTDPVLHFSQSHLGLAKRIFNWQITQNYLSAIKWYVIDDLTKKQTAFNVSVNGAIGNIKNSINDLSKNSIEKSSAIENKVGIVETYITNLENKVFPLEEKITNIANQIHEIDSKLENQIHEIESKHQNELDLTRVVFSHQVRLTISTLFEQILKRKPLSWEVNCWVWYCNSQNNYDNLTDILKNSKKRKKIQLEYLKAHQIFLSDNNTVYKKINDQTIYFSADDNILLELFSFYESFEETTVKIVNKLLKKDLNVLNIGANVGYYTLLMAKQVGPKGKVFAFEPYPNNINFLKKNVSVNGYGNVEIIPKAVSDKEGTTKLWLKESDTWHFISNKKITDLKSISVKTTSIDKFLKDKNLNIDFAIIDAEGSETSILEGMKQTIKENTNLEIIIEYNPSSLNISGSSGKSFLNTIKSLEYSIYVIDEINHKLRIATTEQILNEFPENSFTNLYLTRNPKNLKEFN